MKSSISLSHRYQGTATPTFRNIPRLVGHGLFDEGDQSKLRQRDKSCLSEFFSMGSLHDQEAALDQATPKVQIYEDLDSINSNPNEEWAGKRLPNADKVGRRSFITPRASRR